MYVVPAPGLRVRDPALKDFLPPEGREVPDNDLYWPRRLRDHDVTLGTAPKPEEPAQPQPSSPRERRNKELSP